MIIHTPSKATKGFYFPPSAQADKEIEHISTLFMQSLPGAHVGMHLSQVLATVVTLGIPPGWSLLPGGEPEVLQAMKQIFHHKQSCDIEDHK